MCSRKMRACACLLLSFAFVFPVFSHAQVADAAQRAALQVQLDQIEKDIENNKGTLSTLQSQRTTLERDIAILDNKIKAAQLQIKQSDLTLKQLGNDISDKKLQIADVDQKVLKGEASLAAILRQVQEIDNTPLSALVLSNSVADVFEEMDMYEKLQGSLQNLFTQMTTLRSDLSSKKAALEDKQDQAQKVKNVQVLARNAVQNDEAQKKTILSATKGQESTYQKMIADKQKQAAAIRAALFGLRDSSAIPFGTAYQYAKEAQTKTGVRPAITLAILTEETNLGENVGTGNWRVDMPERDHKAFMQITSELGLDPDTTPVSKKPSYGWGGAMGPAQFIPSTWLLYKDRIAKITGQNPPNPWDGRTAVFAASLLMADNGADKGTRAAERLAALRYFAGWANASKRAYAFYGDDVMDIADKIQSQIDIIGG